MYLQSSEFKELKSMIAHVCTVTKDMATKTLESMKKQDVELAKYVMERDKELDNSSINLDDLSGRIIALYWPRGSDMRYIITCIKTSSDFERIGDHCKKICKQIIKYNDNNNLFFIDKIIQLSEMVMNSVINVTDKFYSLKNDTLDEIITNDSEIDLLKSTTIKEILNYMAKDPSNLKVGVALINVTRRLERIADHAKNIAGLIIYTLKNERPNE